MRSAPLNYHDFCRVSWFGSNDLPDMINILTFDDSNFIFRYLDLAKAMLASLRNFSQRNSSAILFSSFESNSLAIRLAKNASSVSTSCGEKAYEDQRFLRLGEVEKILGDVKADDVKVIPVDRGCGWTDFFVIATGRSSWHIRNIAQALVYKAKQKQKGAQHMILPTVEGQDEGKWVVVDSGRVIVHALDETARAYYDLEGHLMSEKMQTEQAKDLAKAFTKIRRRRNHLKELA